MKKEINPIELDFLLRFPSQVNVTSPVDFLSNPAWGAIKVSQTYIREGAVVFRLVLRVLLRDIVPVADHKPPVDTLRAGTVACNRRSCVQQWKTISLEGPHSMLRNDCINVVVFKLSVELEELYIIMSVSLASYLFPPLKSFGTFVYQVFGHEMNPYSL